MHNKGCKPCDSVRVGRQAFTLSLFTMCLIEQGRPCTQGTWWKAVLASHVLPDMQDPTILRIEVGIRGVAHQSRDQGC
jgi:hypothetical protein